MNDSKAAGDFNEVKGKIKQGLGETFNDQSLANEGAAEQVRGHAQQTWGSVKDTAHNLTHSNTATNSKVEAEHDAHDTRNSVTGAVEHAKESIQHGLDHLTHKAND